MRKPSAGSSSFSSRQRSGHANLPAHVRARDEKPTSSPLRQREAAATPALTMPESDEGNSAYSTLATQAHTGGGQWHDDHASSQPHSAPTAALSPDSAQAFAHPSTYERPGARERIRLIQEKIQQRSEVSDIAQPTQVEDPKAQQKKGMSLAHRLGAPAHELSKAGTGVIERWRMHKASKDSRKESAASTTFEERLAEKNAEKRRVRVKRILLLLAGLALLAVIVWAVAFSPLFALDSRKINVTLDTPSAYLQPEEVSSLVAGHEGESIATMNTGGLAEEIRSEIPLVSAAEISRAWPRGLTIHIQPSIPVACVVSEGTCRAVDARGRDMKIENVESLPHFSAESSLDEKSVASGLAVLTSLTEATRAGVAQITVDRLGQITLQLATGAQVFWGTSEHNEQKSHVLDLLLTRGASYYDVSSPSAPVSK